MVRRTRIAGEELPLALPGLVTVTGAPDNCTILAESAAATCRVGAGRVTLIADAALFEHRELAGDQGAGLAAVIAAALE